MIRFATIAVLLLMVGCQRNPENTDVDAGILTEVQAIRAIDDHAHPVRYTAKDEKPDREFDALPSTTWSRLRIRFS